MKQLKHVSNYHPGALAAVMLIYSDIGDGPGEINGTYFAEEMKYLAREGVKEIDIHINSGGGNILHGLSIMAAIRNFPGKICTVNDGIAASSAGWIFAAGQVRKMVDFGRVMIHNPYNPDDEDGEDNKALANIRDMLLKIFENNSNLDSDTLSDIMDRETWLTAQEAMDLGLVDEVIETSRQAVDEAVNLFKDPLPLASVLNQVQALSKKFNLVNNPKPYKMENLKNHLKLDKEASEEAVLNAVKKLEDKATQAEEKATGLEAEKNQLTEDLEAEKESVKALNKSLAENIVDSAIEAGKFKKEKRDELVNQAVDKGIDFLKTLVESVAEKPAKIKDQFNAGGSSAKNEFEGKTFREIEKEPGGEAYLNKLKSEDKEAFDKLFAAEYSA